MRSRALHKRLKDLPDCPILRARRRLIERFGPDRLILESRCFRRDTSGFGERYWRVSLGGFLEDEATYHPPGFEAPGDRWTKVSEQQGIILRPWRSKRQIRDINFRLIGDKILLCGQKPSDASLRGQNVDRWFISTTRALREHTSRDIVWRPHPLDRDYRHRLGAAWSQIGVLISEPREKSLEADLGQSWAVVTHTSLSSIEAVCEGVPVFPTDPGCPTWSLGNHDLSDIENPVKADREPLLYDLAYRQWTLSELREGTPWRRLREAFESGIHRRTTSTVG